MSQECDLTFFGCLIFMRFIFVIKASIIGRKKEAAAEKLQEAMDEVKCYTNP